MAGIYIHIPFCRKVCFYCDFHFTVSLRNKNRVLLSVQKELEERKEYLQGEEVETVYLGGGTPSVLSIAEVDQLLSVINKNYPVSGNPEVTLEANPDDLTYEYLVGLKNIGINRLSIGIQSFWDHHLSWMNRRHNAEKAENCIHTARRAGFNNINIDLIYGLPQMTLNEWNFNLDKFFRLEIPHLSAYHLTIEPKTVFGVKKKRGQLSEIDENSSVAFFEVLLERMDQNRYQHYEISNFAKDEHYSRHNLGYWFHKKYLGAGPSAHSFDGTSRRWNTRIHQEYLTFLNEGKPYFEEEQLSLEERFNDYILTRLRTSWGINLREISELFGEASVRKVMPVAENYRDFLVRTSDFICLNTKGKFIADRIASEMFWV